jgi:hypothetical protein
MMNIKELTPGVYKICEIDSSYPGGSKDNATVHLLRVTGERMLYFIDHDTLGQHPSKMDFTEYEVLSRYNSVPQVEKCEITISFSDEAGQRFEFTVKDLWTLRSVFDAMPWLKDPFGYVPRKRR